MAKKKTAGLERAYDYNEFFDLIIRLAKEQGHDFELEANLDYFNADREHYDMEHHKDVYRTLEDIEWDIVSETHFGGNEGIYTCFYVRRYDTNDHKFLRYDLATAKTLGTSDEDYMAMHAMAARFELIARQYVDKHQDEFNWTGYDVTGTKDGKYFGGWFCYRADNAELRAQELLQHGADTVTIRNNSTRENKTYEK